MRSLVGVNGSKRKGKSEIPEAIARRVGCEVKKGPPGYFFFHEVTSIQRHQLSSKGIL